MPTMDPVPTSSPSSRHSLTSTSSTPSRHSGTPSLRDTITRWNQRRRCSELFGVIRHAERADIWDALVHGGRWTESDDFSKWPFDPPLSDAGIEGAREMGRRVRDFATTCEARVHVIVSSPYYRCVQTAVEICKQLGQGVRVILDMSLGEVYGPCIMGDNEPAGVTRPMEQLLTYCRFNGVELLPKSIGRWPSWPENLRAGRLRFASRFLVYLRRSAVCHRNFLLVTHADGVASTLRVMPSHRTTIASHVDFGGMFLAKRSCAIDPGKQDVKSPSTSPSHNPSFNDGGTSRWLEKVGQDDDGGFALPLSAREEEIPDEIPRSTSLSSLEDVQSRRWGWQVRTHQIHLQKICTKSGAISYMKRILDRSSLSRTLIEQLLGDLSQDPVSVFHERMESAGSSLTGPNKGEPMQRLESAGSSMSYETYVFGSSNVGSTLGNFKSTAGTRRSIGAIGEGSDIVSPRAGRASRPAKVWRMTSGESSEFGDSASTGYLSRLMSPASVLENGHYSALMSPANGFLAEDSDGISPTHSQELGTEPGDLIVNGAHGSPIARRHRQPVAADPAGQALDSDSPVVARSARYTMAPDALLDRPSRTLPTIYSLSNVNVADLTAAASWSEDATSSDASPSRHRHTSPARPAAEREPRTPSLPRDPGRPDAASRQGTPTTPLPRPCEAPVIPTLSVPNSGINVDVRASGLMQRRAAMKDQQFHVAQAPAPHFPGATQAGVPACTAKPEASSGEASFVKGEAPIVANCMTSSLMQRRAARGMQRPGLSDVLFERPGPLEEVGSLPPEPPTPRTPREESASWPSPGEEPTTPR